jgi:translation elongation factor EF-1beta
MKAFTTKNFEVRPLSNVPVGYGLRKWEVQRLVDGSSIFFQYLTDALMYVEGVTRLDNLSREARQFWNVAANS